jgi:hypothetical protein
MAEWPSGLGKGLQSPVHGFDSRLRLPRFCDQQKHPFRARADPLAVLASRSRVSSLGAQGITQGRVLLVAPATARAIAAYLRARRYHRLADSPFVWLGLRNGGPLDGMGLYRMLRRRPSRQATTLRCTRTCSGIPSPATGYPTAAAWATCSERRADGGAGPCAPRRNRCRVWLGQCSAAAVTAPGGGVAAEESLVHAEHAVLGVCRT